MEPAFQSNFHIEWAYRHPSGQAIDGHVLPNRQCVNGLFRISIGRQEMAGIDHMAKSTAGQTQCPILGIRLLDVARPIEAIASPGQGITTNDWIVAKNGVQNALTMTANNPFQAGTGQVNR